MPDFIQALSLLRPRFELSPPFKGVGTHTIQVVMKEEAEAKTEDGVSSFGDNFKVGKGTILNDCLSWASDAKLKLTSGLPEKS